MWQMTNVPKTRGEFAQVIFAILCACGLTLGGSLPAQAAVPRAGALARAVTPVRLLIPALAVDAPVVGVGQDESDVMAAPEAVDAVAWYNLGPIPGETGNAVMAGHLDDYRGRPAIFWRLDELAVDDEIIVRLSDESEIRFAVISVETYAVDDAPLERIFGVDFERDLNLITCDGTWNAQSKLYERRLVVYTRRIHEASLTNGDDAAQTGTPSTRPLASPSRPADARQDRRQPLTAR